MARPASLSDLRTRLGSFHDRQGAPAPTAPDPIPAPSGAVPEAGRSTGPALSHRIEHIALPLLPFPPAVYLAAAAMLEERTVKGQGCQDLAICVAPGPHVPGAGCPTVTIAELLRGVAEAGS